MRARVLCLLALLAGLMTTSSGCLAVAVGAGAAGTMAYVEGDLEVEEPYDIEQTYSAAREAANDLGLHIIEGETGKDAMSARVVARDSADKRIAIKLTALTRNATKLSIRVGTFGGSTKEHLIHDAIRDNLKAPATVTTEIAQANPSEPQPPGD